MGLFGPFVYKSKKNKDEKYFLHVKERGKGKLYYFSKDSAGALPGIPKGFEISDNPRTNLPFLKKIAKKKTADKGAKDATGEAKPAEQKPPEPKPQ